MQRQCGLCIFISLLIALSCFYSIQARTFVLQPLFRRDYDKTEIKVDKKKHNVQFFSFVTRPDIDAPRWDVKVYDKDALAPGYWFMAPYGIVEQRDNDKAYVGPHIYDASGELIWSGAPTLNNYAAFDFKVQRMGGENVLTMIWQHENMVAILDSSYEFNGTVDFGGHDGKDVNMHDFQLVDNGKKAVVFNRDRKTISREESLSIGYRGRCKVEFPGFEEIDLATGKVLFKWSPEDHIDFQESYVGHSDCDGKGWDYVHSNSIEKLPDGDYLMSSRRAYALYKISHRDGSIIWRLGGKRSNFKWIGEGHFLGQYATQWAKAILKFETCANHFVIAFRHDARCLAQNQTHMLISIMDNAIGPGRPKSNNDHSRGLVIALRTGSRPLTAEVLAHFDHPHGGYAPARGNFQTLPNGNAFLGWTDKALQTEHTPDGKVILEASIPSGLKSYRNYKFPWIGRPKTPPDVHSAAINIGDEVVTTVHVSWNGATEVESWRLYKTNAHGEAVELIASTARQGFETALTYTGYANYVVVEALDSAGNRLGISATTTTIPPSNQLQPAVVQEAKWLQEHSKATNEVSPSWESELDSALGNPIFTFFCGILFCLAAGLSSWAFWNSRWTRTFSWRRQPPLYDRLLHGDDEVESEIGQRKDDEKLSVQDVIVRHCDD